MSHSDPFRASTPRLGARTWAPIFALATLAGAGCDAIIGLGDEPNADRATSDATAGVSSGDGTPSSSATSAIAASGSASASSGDGGAGGDGGGGASTGLAVSAVGSGGGAGGTATPCGTCEESVDCGGDDGLCEDGACRIRVIPLTIPAELAIDTSRGFAVLGDQVAFLYGQDAPTLQVASLRTGALGAIGVPGGPFVSDGTEFVVMTFGKEPSGLLSTFTTITCHPDSEDASLLDCGSDLVSARAPGYYGAIGASPSTHPGQVFVAENSGTDILSFPMTVSGDACAVATFEAGAAPHIFFTPADGVIGWSKYAGAAGGGFAVASDESCSASPALSSSLEEIVIAYGIAQSGDDVVFIAFSNGLFTAYVANDGTIEPVPILTVDGQVTALNSPTVAVRAHTGAFLLPDQSSGIWECSRTGDAGSMFCNGLVLPDGVLLQGRVYAVYGDEDRTVILQDGFNSRLLCIDET